LDLQAYPRESLRRQLADVGIARERHRLRELLGMLPVRLNGKPYEDFDADIVAEVLVYLVGRGLLSVPSAELSLEWGERVCHFYRKDEELPALLVPYFRQGLQQGERCIWLVRGRSEEARQAIGALGDSQFSPDQLEVADADDWGEGDERWIREERRALGQGYEGLRVCADGLHLNGGTRELRIKALGTWRAGAADIGAVLGAHNAALVKNGGCWQRIPTTDKGAAQAILSALIEK